MHTPESYNAFGDRLAAPRHRAGPRNRDYRFTWIRDSAFMPRSLYELGFGREAIEYFGFIIDAVSGGDRNGPFELQIMYDIGGERELTERTLDHLSRWRGARMSLLPLHAAPTWLDGRQPGPVLLDAASASL